MDRRDLNLPQASRTSFWLHGAAWPFPEYDNAETFVDRLVREGLLVRDAVVDAVLHGRTPALSPRSVQYRFLRATGLTRRKIQQIERARQAAVLLERGQPIPDVVYTAGYFDQSHLIRDFVAFSGISPADYLRRLRELRKNGTHPIKLNHLPLAG